MPTGASPSKGTATIAARPSTIWRWANVEPPPRARISYRWASPRSGCAWSVTARNSRSIRDTTKRRSRRTVARTSSSPQSETMKQILFAATFATLLAASAAAPAAAANKEHQQLMAAIRMLQEQSQQLQNLLAALNESLKAVSTRLDQQTEANRKSFADQKLVVDNLSNDVKVIR